MATFKAGFGGQPRRPWQYVRIDENKLFRPGLLTQYVNTVRCVALYLHHHCCYQQLLRGYLGRSPSVYRLQLSYVLTVNMITQFGVPREKPSVRVQSKIANCAMIIKFPRSCAQYHLSIFDPLRVCPAITSPPVLSILGVTALKEDHLHGTDDAVACAAHAAAEKLMNVCCTINPNSENNAEHEHQHTGLACESPSNAKM